MEHDRVFVLVENNNGRADPSAFELFKAGRVLAGSAGVLCACVMGHETGALSEEISFYADEVHIIDNPALAHFQADLYANALERLCRAFKPSVLLMAHSYENAETAPKISCRMGSDLVTDCIGVQRDDQNRLLCTKQVYGGNAVAVFEVAGEPGIVTLQSKRYEPASPSKSKGTVIPFHVDPDPGGARTETVRFVEEETVNLGDAEVIVSGGRGVGKPEGITELERVVHVLRKRFSNVELGASRPLVDVGLVPRSRQIGITGERVSPQVYFAVGISGATQHLSGMIGAKKIITINKSDEAPIFGVSDYGVVGAIEEVLPGFIRKLEELL